MASQVVRNARKSKGSTNASCLPLQITAPELVLLNSLFMAEPNRPTPRNDGSALTRQMFCVFARGPLGQSHRYEAVGYRLQSVLVSENLGS